jgi:hypothetical protein
VKERQKEKAISRPGREVLVGAHWLYYQWHNNNTTIIVVLVNGVIKTSEAGKGEGERG